MCFSLSWLEQMLVNLVIIGAVFAILRLLVPYVVNAIGVPLIGQVINIVLWAVIAIFVIYICFALISCLLGHGGMGFSMLPRGR